MAASEILVTIDHEGATAGVVRLGRHTWLTDRVPQAMTRLDDHRPVVIGLDDRTLQGGLLPAGAVAATVTDDAGERHRAAAGGGAWAIVLDQPCDGATSPVCFRDARGALVAARLPAAWARTRVLDADEPCPACDGPEGWDEVVADDDSRGTQGGAERPTPFAVCRECGHEHAITIFYAGAAGDGGSDRSKESETGRVRREVDAYLRREGGLALRELSFAVCIACGRDGRIGGWGSSDGVLSSVTVEHGADDDESGPWLRITTELERRRYEGEAAVARSALCGILLAGRAGGGPERSRAGIAIWLHAAERAARRRAARAAVQEQTLLVDGTPMVFASVASGRHWSAAGRREDRLVLVTALDVELETVELESVGDPRAALDSM